MMRFESFKVISKLGEGGMANVYLVEYNGKQYALKELKQDEQHSADKISRFKNEAQVIKDFNCPHIVKIVTAANYAGVYENERFLGKSLVYVMEYLKAVSLKDILFKQKLSIEQIRDLFTSVLTALDYCHSRGVIHRDIKPANILLREEGNFRTAVLTDFGIAKMDKKLTKSDRELTSELVTLGAPAYMSPEQIIMSKDVTPQSDLYSVGVVLYEVITGERPYKGKKYDLVAQHKDKRIKPLPPRQLNPEIDDKLEKVTLKLLEKNPKDRLKSAKETLDQLTDATTTTIANRVPSANLTHFFYKHSLDIKISYIKNGKVCVAKSFSEFPVIIGRYEKNKSPEGIRFDLPEELRPISRQHCELFVNERSEVICKDRSRFGTNVNNIFLKNDVCHLKKGQNQLMLANISRLEVNIYEHKELNKGLFAAAAVFILFILVLTIYLTYRAL